VLACGGSISVADAGEADKGGTVWFAIRPEKMRVSSKQPEAANVLEGEIWDIGYLGDMTIYHVRLDDGRVIKTSMLNAQRVFEDPLSWSDRAWVSFAPDAGVVLTR
jgi:putrescine transport system ATP-binding protein